LKALLLAAGLGTRLRPITNDIPKCLVPINGRPLLDYWLEMLVGAGIHEILVNLHYFPEKVVAYLQASRFANSVKTVFEDKLLGTAGTLRKNSSFFDGSDVMLIHADNLSHFSMRDFIAAHNSAPPHAAMTMMLFQTDEPRSCGIVELDNAGMVSAFHEKVETPPGNLANGAVYILKPEVTEFISAMEKDFIDFSSEVIPRYLKRIYAFKNDVYHRDIGTIASYNKGQKEFSTLFGEGR
jgi:mannose-1-phosphate guanylyltransferase